MPFRSQFVKGHSFTQNIFNISEILSLINLSRAVAYLLFP